MERIPTSFGGRLNAASDFFTSSRKVSATPSALTSNPFPVVSSVAAVDIVDGQVLSGRLRLLVYSSSCVIRNS